MSCIIKVVKAMPAALKVSVPRPTTLVVKGYPTTGRPGAPGTPGPPGAGAATLVEGENRESSVTFRPGMAVARHASGIGFIAADRRYPARTAIGLATNTAAPGFSVSVAMSGQLELPNWSLVTGTASLPNGLLYLGAAGALTPVPTTTPGEFLQICGVPGSANLLNVEINQQIIEMR